jgi:signal transduction histidine kinase
VAFVARALCDALAAGQHDKATDAEWLVRLLNEAIGKTRAMARGLWPVNLERESFVLSLQRLADDLESIFGVSCAVQVIDTPHLSSNIAAHHVFRVMQEAATNAIKHGQARRLTFRVQHHGGDLVAIVSNDGLAPVPEALADPQGLGVVGMRLRADALGGRLDVGPMAGGGCCVTLTLPGAAASPTERARDETSAISSTEGSEHDR